MVSNALENTTVDIAQQFTVIIKAQQAYSATARTISTADTMLETLIMV
jgi:flagellar hook protein FlgE